MKKLVMFIVAVMLSGISVSAQKLPIVDVALNKPVYVSSIFDETKTDKTFMVDNDDEGYATYWQPAAGEFVTKTYAIVDLTQEYAISRIELDMSLKRNFNVSVSDNMDDDRSWITVHSQGGTEFEGETLSIVPEPGGKYRYVKVSRKIGGGMGDELKIYSLRVYAPADYNMEEIARGKNITANTNGEFWASTANITDRDFNTMVFADKGEYNPYITIDLGEETDVGRIELMQCINDSGLLYDPPAGKDIRKGGKSDVAYTIYMSNESLMPDALAQNAEKVAEYKKNENWGVAHSITAFDIAASQPYRYMYIYTEGSNTLVFAEIFIYSRQADATEAVETENILIEKSCIIQSGNGEAENINDGDEGTEWTLENPDDYATFNLVGGFSVSQIELITNGAADNFEIWGGGSKNFEEDKTKIKISDGENLISEVNTENITEYITVKPSKNAVFPISIKELGIYAEKGVRLVKVKTETVKSDNALIDAGENQTAAALQIYFGDNEKGRRNIILLGGNDKNNLTPVARIGAKTVSSDIPFTLTLTGEQRDYRYFAVKKEKGVLRGGVSKDGKYEFFETDETVDIEEFLVYTKKENLPPPSTGIEIISQEAVDADGNAVTDFCETGTGARVILKNGGAEKEKAVIICAAVDEDNIILSMGQQEVSVEPGEEKELTVYAENIPENAKELKVFTWCGFGENQVPHTVHKTLIGTEN